MSFRHPVLFWLSMIALSVAVTYGNATPAPVVTIPAFTKAHPGNHPSPDGRYFARLVPGEGEAGILTVYRIRRGHLSSPVLRRVWDVEGALWLPGQPHSLAFGVSGIYGTAMLGL